MDIDEIVGVARSFKGALIHREGLVQLCKMARMAPPGVGVEIGVYRGASLIAWALARAGMGEAVGVDDWSYPDPPNLKGHAEGNIARSGCGAALYDMTSEEAARVIEGPLAFVHIDADHRLDAVRRDIELWTPKVMRGGVVAFHDYGRRRDDVQVQQAVDEWQQREPWECLGEALTEIGFRKR
jgi:predicted O-methyltransferase YrrM